MADPEQHGQAADIARAVQELPLQRISHSHVPAQPDPVSQQGAFIPPEPGPLQGDVTGFDGEIFNTPSGRPDEPITQGVPFGPGSGFVRQRNEDDRTFLLRVAGQLRTSPEATRAVQQLADEMLAGR